MLFKGVLIGLGGMRILQNVRHAFGIPALTKSRFGKNQSHKVLTPDRLFHSLVLHCLSNKLSMGFQSRNC